MGLGGGERRRGQKPQSILFIVFKAFSQQRAEIVAFKKEPSPILPPKKRRPITFLHRIKRLENKNSKRTCLKSSSTANQKCSICLKNTKNFVFTIFFNLQEKGAALFPNWEGNLETSGSRREDLVFACTTKTLAYREIVTKIQTKM